VAGVPYMFIYHLSSSSKSRQAEYRVAYIYGEAVAGAVAYSVGG